MIWLFDLKYEKVSEIFMSWSTMGLPAIKWFYWRLVIIIKEDSQKWHYFPSHATATVTHTRKNNWFHFVSRFSYVLDFFVSFVVHSAAALCCCVDTQILLLLIMRSDYPVSASEPWTVTYAINFKRYIQEKFSFSESTARLISSFAYTIRQNLDNNLDGIFVLHFFTIWSIFIMFVMY